MKLKALLMRSVAAGVMATAVPLVASIPLAAPAAAAAKVNVSINIGTFYDRLSPYGDWVSLNGRNVWVPARRPAQWQPYTQGHWAYTHRYGWMWVSAEPFGWATYHYGRWGHADNIGWYWVPGYRWAPAWVSWRRSDDYVAWSPLPVDYPDEFGVNVTIGAVPDFYWQVVPSRSFLSVNLFGVIIHDRHRADTYMRGARHVGGVRIVDNVIVNNVIELSFVEKRTHKKVRVYKVNEAKAPGKGTRLKGDSIEVFAPQVNKGGDHKPKLKPLDEVQARHKKEVGTSQQPTTQQPEAADQTGKKKKEKVQEQTTQPQTGDQSGKKKKKEKVQEQTTQPQTGDQSGKKKKKEKVQEQTTQPQTGDQSGKKKKKEKVQKKTTQPEAGDQSGKKKKKEKVQKTTQQPKAADQTDKKKKKKKKQQEQDQQQPVVQ